VGGGGAIRDPTVFSRKRLPVGQDELEEWIRATHHVATHTPPRPPLRTLLRHLIDAACSGTEPPLPCLTHLMPTRG
jgi:hypothetical protein